LYIAVNAIIQIPSSLKYSSIFHFRYVLFAISVYLFFKIYEQSKINKKLFLTIFLLSIIILLFDSCFQFFVGENILGQELSKSGYRVSSFFGDELILGSFLMRLLPIILWYLFYLKIDINSKNFFFIIFFSVYFFVIYISGGRTAFALTVFTFLSFVIFVSNLRYVLFRSAIVFSICAFIVALTNIGKEDITHRMFVKTYKQLVYKNAETDKIGKNILKDKNLNFIDKIKNINIFSPNHHGHLIITKELFTKNLIFGVGPKGFRHYCRSVNYDPPKGICSTHPHNILAQILSELGVIGLLFYLIFIVFILRIFFKNIRKKSTNYEINGLLVISIGLLINLFPFVPSGNFFNNWISSFLYFKIGLFIFSYKKLSN
jgi:O-antigen ligase